MLHQQQCQMTNPTIPAEKLQHLLSEISEHWQMDTTEMSISRRFEFDDYCHTIAFVNAVAWIALQQDHHPELRVGYQYCDVYYTTHTVNGLSLNDFICAARIDQLLN